MKTPPDESYALRASIGVGASLGTLLGAILAALFYSTPQAVIIGSIIGAGLGAVVGSRIRSQAFQFLWIEYSRDVARRLIISVLLFLAPFSLYIYLLKVGTTLAIEILVLFATALGGLFLIYSVGVVISQLDDLLRKILLEAIALGFGLSLFVFLTLGLLSLVIPIPTNWLVGFIIMLTCMLVGRIVVAVKYQ
jgi:hypothetical protein